MRSYLHFWWSWWWWWWWQWWRTLSHIDAQKPLYGIKCLWEFGCTPHKILSASPQLSCQKSEENSINFQHWPLLDRVEWRLLGGGHFFRGFGDFVIMASSSEKLIALRLYAKEGMKQQLKLSQVFSSCQLCQLIDVANNALSVTKQHRNNFRPTRIWCHNFDWINQF